MTLNTYAEFMPDSENKIHFCFQQDKNNAQKQKWAFPPNFSFDRVKCPLLT
jgi:hypothetical protein